MKSGFAGDHPMQYVMKLGVVFKNFIELFSVESILCLLDIFVELFERLFGNTFTDQPDRITFQSRPDIEEIFHFLARIARYAEAPAFQRLNQSL